MRPIKTKHKLALTFSLFFFSFLVLLSLMFFAVISIIFNYQVRRDLSKETNDVVINFIESRDGDISFKKDNTNQNVRQYLFNEGLNAVFFNNKLEVLRKYGVFELTDSSEENDNNRVTKIAKESISDNKVKEKELIWHNQNLVTFSTPIKFEGGTVGVMILAKSQNVTQKIVQTMLAVFVGLGFFGLVGSLLLGIYLANKAFSPVRKIARVVEQIDLDRLDKTVEISGHPEDEFVELASKFNEMIERLKDTASRQKEFVANASHELKTPLSRAVLAIDLILSNPNTKKEELKLVKKDILDIGNLIEKLLVLSRIKEGKDLPKGVSDISTVVNKVEQIFKYELEKNHNFLKKTLEQGLNLPIPEEFLTIIMGNLVSNAIKFSKTGSSIDIETYSKDNSKLILVRNYGKGIEKNDLGKVFDRFYRGKGKVAEGHGIGLSLVKQICDFYKIKVDVESKKDNFTQITLST